ncbi:MAG: cysteine desulfurase [Acidimicrobiales bacterium]|nr:cysteine desulfurase [Acidimicrobiales bacterium]
MTGPYPGAVPTAVAYLDHAASTPVRPQAVETVTRVLTEFPGNPSGSHGTARRARQVLEEAREVVAAHLGARPREVVFTSGGTEADNLAVLGAARYRHGGRAVCPAAEHHAVLHPVGAVGGTVVAVDGTGLVDLDALADALDDRVAVVSVMLANNEVGTVTPLADVASLVRERAPRAVLHTDAVQAAAWLDVSSLAAPAGAVSISGHKLGGPKGVGVLVVRDGVALVPQLLGGGQELERRSGTQDVAGAAGLAAALAASATDRAEAVQRVARLRDRLADGLAASVPGLVETVPRARTLPGWCHVCIEGVEAEALLVLLDRAGVHASAASACASGAVSASHVLAAMGVPARLARGGLRLTLGVTSTPADVDRALDVVPGAVARLRGAR